MHVDINIKIISGDGEYQVIIEGDGFAKVSRASSIKELLSILDNEVSEALKNKEERETLRPSECTLRGWYIRLPISKIMNIITYMVKTGYESTEGMLRYLDENRLSRSNYRVIIPTLTALGLWRQGRLTKDAEELGKALLSGTDALEILFRISMRNCIIRSAIEGLADGRTIDDVIRGMGLKRQDEVRYTVNFLEILMSTREFQCLSFLRALKNYLSNNTNCMPGISPPMDCVPTVVTEVYDYLANNKGFYMAELMSDVDIPINLNSVITQRVGNHISLSLGGKAVGAVLGDLVITSNNYAPRAREVVDKLEEDALRIMKINNLNFTLIVVPILIQGECSRMKVYVMVGTRAGDWIARVFDIP